MTDGNEVADAYNGCVIIVQDAGDSHYEPRMILDWTAGRVVTVGTAYSFTPAVSDKVWIFNTTYLWDIYRKISSTVHYVDTTKTGAGAGQGTGFQRYDAAGDDP